MSLTNNNR